jgi:hypothetical protein
VGQGFARSHHEVWRRRRTLANAHPNNREAAPTDANLRETAANVRVHLLGLLRTFASPDEQRSYRRVAPISVPTELVCGWADDLYHPESPVHAMAFSPAERAALAGFDAELRRSSDHIPGGDVEIFIDSAAGKSLARAATVALAAFGVGPDAIPSTASDPEGA